MESVPGAVATGLTGAGSYDAATNDWFRTRLRRYPVATAPGTDLIPQTKTLPTHQAWLGRRLRAKRAEQTRFGSLEENSCPRPYFRRSFAAALSSSARYSLPAASLLLNPMAARVCCARPR